MGFDLNFGGSCFGGYVFSFWISWCWTAGICDPGELVDLSFGRTIHDIYRHFRIADVALFPQLLFTRDLAWCGRVGSCRKYFYILKKLIKTRNVKISSAKFLTHENLKHKFSEHWA